MAEIHLAGLELLMHAYESHEIFGHPVYSEMDDFDILASNMPPATGVQTSLILSQSKAIEFVYSITTAGIRTCIAAKGGP